MIKTPIQQLYFGPNEFNWIPLLVPSRFWTMGGQLDSKLLKSVEAALTEKQKRRWRITEMHLQKSANNMVKKF